MKMSTNHFQRVRVPLLVLVAIGMIAGTFCFTYPISTSSLTAPEHRLRFPYIFLSATISWEPAKTLGSFVLSMGAVPFTLAILARKLELDLRRTQLPRKEAPIGEVPGVCDEYAWTETAAFALHAAGIGVRITCVPFIFPSLVRSLRGGGGKKTSSVEVKSKHTTRCMDYRV